MQKQKKNKKIKTLYRYRFLFKSSKTLINTTMSLLNFSIQKIIILKVTQNNVFCTLMNFKTYKTLLITSSGIEKTPITKKVLNFNSKIILNSFLQKIKDIIKKEKIAINIIAPLKIKKSFVNIIKLKLRNNLIFFNTQPKKPFNGCKSSKKRRKKQRKGLRIYN